MFKKVAGVVLLLILTFAAIITSSAGEVKTGSPVTRFAILGDRTGVHQQGIYGQIVAEIERLKPDFVVTVGDMIEGYTEDTSIMNSEWKEYLSLVEPLSMPIYYTPGNHDITTDGMQEHYKRNVGAPYYSFDIQDIHFVILDNSRTRTSNEMSKEQIEWLIDDLTEYTDRAITFIFMHKPFWYETTALDKQDTLHSIFVEYGVDAVFTGHYHCYFVGNYDGIAYTGVGSSGGASRTGPSDMEYHFMWVTVDSKDISIAPITMGSVMAWDHATADDLHLMDRIDRLGIAIENAAPVSEDLTVPTSTITVNLSNLSDELPVKDTLRWDIPKGWTIIPESQYVTVPVGERLMVPFEVTCDDTVYPVPTLSLDFPFVNGKTYTVRKNLQIIRQITCNQTTSPPIVDGSISEPVWDQCASHFFSPDGGPMTIDSAFFYFAYDDDNLYLAAYCYEPLMDSLYASVTERDGAVYGEDCVGYFFCPDRNEKIVYQVYINPLGTIFDQKIIWNDEGVYNTDHVWSLDCKVKTTKEVDSWSMEARIPLVQLGEDAMNSKEWGLNFRRKQKRFNSSADWQVPIDYDPKTFGVLLFQ